MKKDGDDAQTARGQITYTNAKADFDAVIAGLIAVLSAGQTPASLQAKLSSGASGLVEFCGTVSNLLPKAAGQTEKDVMVDIAKMIPFEQLFKMLSEGVSALYTNHRNDDALNHPDPVGVRKMACVFRGQGSSIARALLPALLFVVFAITAARAQLYEQPVLVIDPGMHTAPIRDAGVDAAGRIAVTGSWDKTLRVWSLTDGELLRTPHPKTQFIRSKR